VAENKTITLPDVGDFSDIEIIEILVAVGDVVEAEQSIVVLESDKATMEIPSPFAGKIETIDVSVGDRLNQGDKIATMAAVAGSGAQSAAPAQEAKPVESPPMEVAPAPPPEVAEPVATSATKSDAAPGKPLRPHPGAGAGDLTAASSKMVHASPSIRKYARELGVDLQRVIGSGPKGRIAKSDVKAFVKTAISGGAAGAGPGAGISVSSMPEIDYSRFGDIGFVELGDMGHRNPAAMQVSTGNLLDSAECDGFGYHRA